MAPVTVAIGVVLITLGVVGYLPSQAATALIPAYFGVALLLLGGLAFQDKMRKHVMHLAAMIGLIGFLGAAFMAGRVALSGNIERPLAFGMQIGMAITCAIFVALCIKSFIDARKRRQAAGEKPAA